MSAGPRACGTSRLRDRDCDRQRPAGEQDQTAPGKQLVSSNGRRAELTCTRAALSAEELTGGEQFQADLHAPQVLLSPSCTEK